MSTALLTGAGFSRNWGGWPASDAPSGRWPPSVTPTPSPQGGVRIVFVSARRARKVHRFGKWDGMMGRRMQSLANPRQP